MRMNYFNMDGRENFCGKKYLIKNKKLVWKVQEKKKRSVTTMNSIVHSAEVIRNQALNDTRNRNHFLSQNRILWHLKIDMAIECV